MSEKTRVDKVITAVATTWAKKTIREYNAIIIDLTQLEILQLFLHFSNIINY